MDCTNDPPARHALSWTQKDSTHKGQCIYTDKGPHWILYHIGKQGGKGKLINSIDGVEPPTIWEDPITYVMVGSTTTALHAPPWGTVWICNSQKVSHNLTLPDYSKEILSSCMGILERDACKWLLSKYGEYPSALERLSLKLKVLAVSKGTTLRLEDIYPLVPIGDNTPFLWTYQRALCKPQGLSLIYRGSNTDLWKAFMVDGGLMKYLKANMPQYVYNLLTMREDVNRGVPIVDSAILWHLSTM